MGIENLNRSDTHAAAGADDLNHALSDNGETEYVTEGSAPKKASPLVIVGLILAALGGGYLFFSRGGPDDAAGATTADDPTKQTVTQFLDGGGKNIELMQKMLRDTEKVVQQFLKYPSMKQVPLDELQTNPFRFRAPAVEGAAVSETDTAVKKRREEERQAALKAVGGLKLQSVIHSGSRKACMVNNTLYTEGQLVDAFVIERINPGSVIVKSGVYRFELKMQK